MSQTIIEKAKRYDEVTEELKGLLESIREDKREILEEDIISIFPELKESNDERIKKWLISQLKIKSDDTNSDLNIMINKAISWLEKQGEQKPQGKTALEAINEEKVDNANKLDNANKDERKFHIGDWVVFNNNKIVFLIKSYNSGYCTLEDINGKTYFPCMPPTKEEYHRWSIKDAKPGDILASKDKNSILIFRHLSLDDDNTFVSYCSTTFSSYYKIQVYDEVNWLSTNFVPATKAQRDFLLQKMTEAGYEYDAEKEQLRGIKYDKSKPNFCHHEVDLSNCSEEYRKAYYDGWNNCNQQHSQLKAEQTSVWSEDDDIMLHNIIDYFENRTLTLPYHTWTCIPWLKSLRNKINCKTNWSEEDEKKRNLLIDILNVNHPNGAFKVNPANTLNMEAIHTEELVSWLKSLRPQNTWKPSDAQIEVLKEMIADKYVLDAYKVTLKGLQEQLLKLKKG